MALLLAASLLGGCGVKSPPRPPNRPRPERAPAPRQQPTDPGFDVPGLADPPPELFEEEPGPFDLDPLAPGPMDSFFPQTARGIR
jgi:hypothetical protein